MINELKNFFFPSIEDKPMEEKLGLLEFMKEYYIKDIQKRKRKHALSSRYSQLEDYDKIIEFSTLITEKLIKTYEVNEDFTPFELKLLNKILNEKFSVSFYLLSDLNDNEEDKELLITALVKEGFEFVDNVGYVNIERRVSLVKLQQ